MPSWIPDDIDFAAYALETEARMKVRRASQFADELAAEFKERGRGHRSVMFSTKLRDAIEFRPSELTCWAGFNGHRKSMFTGQVALDLCVQREPTLLMSLEMTPQKTLARMCRQAMATDWPSVEQRERFLRWTDDRLWLFDHVGRLRPAQCIAVCNYFATELKGRHVFIDSMMKVCQSEESMDEQKQLVSDLCDVAKETGLHVHLVAHCRKPSGAGEDHPPTKYDIRGTAAVSDQSHNIVLVWQNKAKRAERDKTNPDPDRLAKPDALIIVDKQRNGTFEGRLQLWFDDTSLRFVDDRTSPVEPYVLQDVQAENRFVEVPA
jgi:twinkle protein